MSDETGWQVQFFDIAFGGSGVQEGKLQMTLDGQSFTIIAMSLPKDGHYYARYLRDDICAGVKDEAQVAFLIPKGWTAMPIMRLAFDRAMASVRESEAGSE